MKKNIRKSNSLSKIKKKVWSIFSKYIRTRDSINGYCTCYTCGDVKPIGECHAGHYIHGNTKPTYFDTRNVHAQCVKCNMYLSGNLTRYAIHLEEEYGRGILQELEIKSNGKVFSRVELLALVEVFKQKIREIEL